MNPFTTPDRIFVAQAPQDMRAGIQRLAAIVAADFGDDPVSGALYCFVPPRCGLFGPERDEPAKGELEPKKPRGLVLVGGWCNQHRPPVL